MTPSTAEASIDQLAAAPSIAVAALRPLLEQMLARGWWRLRFQAELEGAYDEQRVRSLAQRMYLGDLLGLIVFWVLSVQAGVLSPRAADALAAARMAVEALIFANLLTHFSMRNGVPAWRLEVTTSVGLAAISAYVLFANALTSSVAMKINAGALLLNFMYSSIYVRQQFRYALASSLAILLGYVATAPTDSPMASTIFYGNLRLFGTALVFTLVANYILELRERRNFLLHCMELDRQRQLAANAEALRHLSLSDPLTGLANRRSFDAALAGCLEASQPVGLLLLDVDFFKLYNDLYGHPAGDFCLQRIASLLEAQAAQHNGLTARIGGEEFALWLPGCGKERALRIAQMVCSAVHALSIPHGDAVVDDCVTVSIGVAAGWEPGPASPGALIKAADRALYQAKARGRNRIASADWPPRETYPTGERQIIATPVLPDRDIDDIELLRGVLSGGFRQLRFPHDLENAFNALRNNKRRHWLFGLGVTGALYVTGYVGLGQPLFADLDGAPLRQLVALDALVLAPGILLLLLPLPGWLAEFLFAALATVVGVAVALLVAPSTALTRYSYALSLFLVPMFSAVIAAQPFRFSLAASLIVCLTTAACLYPAEPVAIEIWWNTTFILFDATLYTLVAGYLLDWGSRREYLLKSIDRAQGRVLARDTAELHHLASTDALTNLPNRRAFEVTYERARAASAASVLPLALLLIDVDYFKPYNDSCGHPAGDECLQHLGQMLLRWRDEADVPSQATPRDHGLRTQVARLGGEEFGVLLPAHDAGRALGVAALLCARVRDLGIVHPCSSVGNTITVSIGVASLDQVTPGSSRDLLSRADAALYRAKRQGRNRAVL